MSKLKSFIGICTCLILVLFVSGCTQKQGNRAQENNSGGIVFLGDSITAGLSSPTTHTVKSYPWWVGKLLNLKVANYGADGGTISGTKASDLSANLKGSALKKAKIIVISYGINDYTQNRNLDEVTAKLDNSIGRIKEMNSKATIIGVLPLNAFIVPNPVADTAGDAMQVTNKAGYSEDVLCNNLSAVYAKLGIPVLDWRSDPVITQKNVSQLTWDGVLHPNKKGYHIIGMRVAAYILQNK